MAQGQGAAPPGVRDRRLASRRGRPQRPARKPPARLLRARQPALRRQGRHRVQSPRLSRLNRPLGDLATGEGPFSPAPPAFVVRTAHWVRRELVAAVTFGEWTDEGILRHASYIATRDDKEPRAVVREAPRHSKPSPPTATRTVATTRSENAPASARSTPGSPRWRPRSQTSTPLYGMKASTPLRPARRSGDATTGSYLCG
jgi:ATP dependent DNA ligase C terminal region